MMEDERSGISAVFHNLQVESAHTNRNGKLWVWCDRKEATHLSCYGVSGRTIAVEDAKVVGHVSDSWSEERVIELRASAERLIGEYVF